MDEPIELLAGYFTLAGDVYPGGPTEVSAWQFEDRVAAAARAGFRGIGIHSNDLDATSNRLGLSTMRSILVGHGIEYVELEFLSGWCGTGKTRPEVERTHASLLHAADVLGVRHIKAGGEVGTKTWPLDLVAERFASLCARAAETGTLVALEPMPFTNLRTHAEVLDVVQQAGAPNGGLCLDVWHLYRGNIPVEGIRQIPGELLAWVELNDGPAAAPPDGSLWDDAVQNRTFCGDGELPLDEFLGHVAATGYSGPFGVEIMGSEYRQVRPLDSLAQRVFDTTLQQFGNPAAGG